HDDYLEQLHELIQAKFEGGEPFTTEEQPQELDETEDLSDLLAKLSASPWRPLGRSPSDRRLTVRRIRSPGRTHIRRFVPKCSQNTKRWIREDPPFDLVRATFLVAGTRFEPATSGL
ncbi:MAG TPA: hypothetical protein VN888_23360, partial [Mycobacterium sp.]|nr:hypothetical protein [Mycobacterium sp.]